MAEELPTRRPGRRLAGPAEGETVGGYRLESRIGAGGMAVVFRARDERLDRLVALKVLTPALTLDSEFRERFIRESRAASVVDHPHIIPVYGAGEDEGVLYLAMRHVSGGDLHSVVEREGPLAPSRVTPLLAPVASALDAAHQAGIIHRDVKPANILIDAGPRRPDHPYLSDFGLAKRDLSAALTATGEFVGTAGFAAPEQIDGQPPKAASDQYALACVAYTMLTASLPFRHGSVEAMLWAQMSQPPPRVLPSRPDLPAAVDEVIARGLARRPADRFPSCAAFAAALGAALEGRAPAPETAGPVRPVAVPAQTVPGPASPVPRPAREAPESASPTVVPREFPAPERSRRQSRALAFAVAAAAAVTGLAATVATLMITHPGVPSGQQARNRPGPAGPAALKISPTPSATLSGPGADAEALAFGPDGTLEILGQDNRASAYDIATGRVRSSFDIGSSFAATDDALLSLDGTVFVDPPGLCGQEAGTGSCAHSVTDSLYNVASKQVMTSVQVGNGGSAAATGDFAFAAADEAGTGVQLWNLRSLSSIATLPVPGRQAVQSVAVSPDADTVAAASAGAGGTHQIRVWNVSTQAVTATVTVPRAVGKRWETLFQAGAPLAVDGPSLAASDGLTTDLYRLKPSARRTAAIAGGLLGLSPDGTILAATDPSNANAVDLWDTSTGTKAATLSVPGTAPEPARAVFSSDGKSFALSCNDGHAYVWTIRS